MLRRFNYTGRRKINREDVPISLSEGPLRTFNANLDRLADYKFPEDARVFVEAYEHTAYMRFPFGTIGQITAPVPAQRLLTEFEASDAIRFRVKVVNIHSDGQLLGEADAILPLTSEESDQNKLPLLPVRSQDLDQELWSIEFPEVTQDRPVLVINIHAGDRTEIVRSASFMSLALPSVLRAILTRILLIEEAPDMDDESDWRCMWLQFGRGLLPTSTAPPDDDEEKYQWIEDVLAAFCSKFRFLTKYQHNEEETNAVAS
jgi:hypothetical protein